MSDESSEYRARPKADTIPCPFLTAAYNNGELVPEEDGTVHHEVIDETLSRFGIRKRLRTWLAQAVTKADGDDSPTTLNLFELRGSGLDHAGSTGIRDPEVNPEKLADLLAFGENGRMYLEHFARASLHFEALDPGFQGLIQETFDMAALVHVFGRTDENGKRYLTDADVAGLWLEGRYPEGWTRPEPESIGMDILGGAGQMSGTRLAHRIRRLF